MQTTLPFQEQKLSIAERFADFHARHPEVYDNLAALALELRRGGHKRWGMRNLYEKLRFDMALRTGEKPYQLNDNFIAHYARELMKREPELDGFFETRGD